MTIASFRIGSLLICRTPSTVLDYDVYAPEWYTTSINTTGETDATYFNTLQDAVDSCINILLLERSIAMIDSGHLTTGPPTLTAKSGPKGKT